MIKNIINRTIDKVGRRLLTMDRLRELELVHPEWQSAVAQRQLWLNYRLAAIDDIQRLTLRDVGFKVCSQTDEDGIILFLLALIGDPKKVSVEICAANGQECNTSNLIMNHQWHGLLVDGDAGQVARGRAWYRKHPATYAYPPVFAHAWITRDNINDIIASHGFEGEIDLLSVDVDGVDYWLWDACTVVQPRVVVIEYQCSLGSERACTVPYADDFSASDYPKTNGWLPNFAGASLPAMVKLGKSKGYRLVGCNSLGFNAFFVREDLLENVLPTASVESCLQHPRVKWSMRERAPTAADLPWQDV
ncbi:hypothetical protein [Parasphingorhabdus sp.]|uniref:hypothetical protein n=1 Tax=Parasphingorhabdus sp. TaxID=2709688 RepID=UPI003A8CEA23